MSTAAPRLVVCLMLKAPRAGTVKTRLALDLGPEKACEVYRGLVDHQWGQLSGRSCEIHYAPADALPVMRAWLGPAACYFPQPEGDLGDRLCSAMLGAFARGAARVIFLGGDCPDVTGCIIGEAERLLQSHAAVIGPAEDGGYYLLGVNAPDARLFDCIDWSTEKVFSQTMARVRELGLSCGQLPRLADVDDLASLQAAQARHEFLR
jgi:rSAM/selenodomain-associated transferase 1